MSLDFDAGLVLCEPGCWLGHGDWCGEACLWEKVGEKGGTRHGSFMTLRIDEIDGEIHMLVNELGGREKLRLRRVSCLDTWHLGSDMRSTNPRW